MSKIKLNEEKNRIRLCFNRAAKTYDDNCGPQIIFGGQLINMLKKQPFTHPDVIDLGCGTGIITENLAGLLNYKKFMAIDISDKLLKVAKSHLSFSDIILLQADFDNVPVGSASFDIVFSNMALQWSLNINNSLFEVNRILRNDGIFAFALPISGTFAELIKTVRRVDKNSDFNIFLKKENLLALLKRINLNVLDFQIDAHSCYYKDIFELLKAIKGIGAMHVKFRKHAAIRGKSYFQKLEKYYSFIDRNKNKRLSLTYVVGYFITQKKGNTWR